MRFIPVKTRAILPPRDNIYPILDRYLPKLKERDVVVITSKVLGIHQGRTVKIGGGKTRDDLVKTEAEAYILRHLNKFRFCLSIKEHTLIASAGIDESNGNGYYILWPKNPAKLALEICNYLKKKFRLKELAVVITDSHTIPMRYGVMGISIGFFGLVPLKDYRGHKDIFGRKLKVTRANVIDSVASLAVLIMGESNERTPILVVRDMPNLQFTNKPTYKELVIPYAEDIYAPLLKVFRRHRPVRNRGRKA